jgi:hypothetical protein
MSASSDDLQAQLCVLGAFWLYQRPLVGQKATPCACMLREAHGTEERASEQVSERSRDR